jgi:sn-glycerol 3-phosphate transport system substrate-binding protein
MRLQWVFILVLTALIGVGSALPAWAGEPITATFWYSYGGKVRQVTEDMVKKFNSSQTKYRIDGSFQGDYFQALAKIRAAITTKTAPPSSTSSARPCRICGRAGCSRT